MDLKSLMQELKSRVSVPSVPSEKSAQGTREAAWIKAVRPVPCVPLDFADADEAGQTRQLSEAVSDPVQAAELLVKSPAAAKMPGPNHMLSALLSSAAAEMPDPDRWCWPHSLALTSQEIDTLIERTGLFTRRGLPALEAELLGDKLVNRDREADDRRLCLECVHLSGHAGALRCVQWQLAGLGEPGVPAGLHLVLQRCDGFKDQNSQRTTS